MATKGENLIIDPEKMDKDAIEAMEKPDFAQFLFEKYKAPTKAEQYASWAEQFSYVFVMHYFMRNVSEVSLYAYDRYPEHMKSEYTTNALKLCPLLFAWILSGNAQENIARKDRVEPSKWANITAWTAALLTPSLTKGIIDLL
jgi:hypothetical protein